MLEAFNSGCIIPVADMLEPPDTVAPTARTFFAMAGLLTEHEKRNKSSPSFPAEDMIRFSGFCAKHNHNECNVCYRMVSDDIRGSIV